MIRNKEYSSLFHAEALHHAYGADGDALGAPCQAIVGGHQGEGLQHLPDVVKGFAHTHEHHVCEVLALGDGEHLVQYLGSGQVGGEALLAGHAEEAVHLASHLGGDAECGPFAIFRGYVD